MNKAIANGAKIIVAPGFLQADAMKAVATKNPDVKFIFIDGWNLGLSNVTAVSYKEESGYMAGYAAVMDGYTKLGATLGGGGTNPACNRFGYGYVQGAIAAAAEKKRYRRRSKSQLPVRQQLLRFGRASDSDFQLVCKR